MLKGDLPTNDDILEDNEQKPAWKDPPEHTPLDQYTILTEKGKQDILWENTIINAKIIFPKVYNSQYISKVINRKKGTDNSFIVRRNENPTLKRYEWIIQYPYG